MPDWRERLEGLRTRWSEASPKARAGVLAALGVVATVAGLFWLRGSDPDMTILYSSLSQQDAAHIVERLRAMNVEYELTDGGATIQVPEASVHETRLTLANEGLPSGGGVGFELFDTQRFGSPTSPSRSSSAAPSRVSSRGPSGTSPASRARGSTS